MCMLIMTGGAGEAAVQGCEGEACAQQPAPVQPPPPQILCRLKVPAPTVHKRWQHPMQCSRTAYLCL
jgi:hypothetical protein